MADPIFEAEVKARIQAGKKVKVRKARQPRFPKGPRMRYRKALENRVKAMRAAVLDVARLRLPGILERARLSALDSRARLDAWADEVEELKAASRIAIHASVEAPDHITGVVVGDINQFNRTEWRRYVAAAIGVRLITAEPWLADEMKAWAKQNSELIQSLEDDAIKKVAQWTYKGVRDGWRWEDIAKNIEEAFEVTRKKARFIARDQTAKLNKDLTKSRQQQAGVKGYFWRNSRDERVRGNPGGLYPDAVPSHWHREGKRYLWSKPPAGGHPGEDYNCRCTAEADLQGVLESLK